MVCCIGGGLLSGAAGGFSTGGGNTGDVPSPRGDPAPPGGGPALLVHPGQPRCSACVSLLALLAALILLALPKANEFFRKPTAGWEPPAPGAAYPGYPQAPGQPGYPQASGEPGYPSTWRTPSYPPPPTGRRTGRTTRPPDGPARVDPAADRS